MGYVQLVKHAQNHTQNTKLKMVDLINNNKRNKNFIQSGCV